MKLASGKKFVYVLLCEGERYYVRYSENLHHRLRSHFARNIIDHPYSDYGSIFTRKHRPLSLLAYWIVKSKREEVTIAGAWASVFGRSNVGGGY